MRLPVLLFSIVFPIKCVILIVSLGVIATFMGEVLLSIVVSKKIMLPTVCSFPIQCVSQTLDAIHHCFQKYPSNCFKTRQLVEQVTGLCLVSDNSWRSVVWSLS